MQKKIDDVFKKVKTIGSFPKNPAKTGIPANPESKRTQYKNVHLVQVD